MKTLLISLTLLLSSNIASAGWFDDAKEKASSAMDSISETTSEAYQSTKEYVDENKDGWVDSGKQLYEKSKNLVTGEDEDVDMDAKKK